MDSKCMLVKGTIGGRMLALGNIYVANKDQMSTFIIIQQHTNYKHAYI